MSRPTFSFDGEAVTWAGRGRDIRLQDRECEMLLNVFERERDVELFNQLYDAHLLAGGIERCSYTIRKAA